jgi:XTP/dITP diphosphohydrolase
VTVRSAAEIPGAPEVEETGATFAANAALKAEAVRDAAALPALADDSGLCVDALAGAPGVRSARFAGEAATDAQNNALLLERLQAVPEAERTARFVCVLALAVPGRETQFVEGTAEGRILRTPRGAGGFGYDPLFFSPELGQTFAEAPAEQKHRVSHRGRALAALRRVLEDAGGV